MNDCTFQNHAQLLNLCNSPYGNVPHTLMCTQALSEFCLKFCIPLGPAAKLKALAPPTAMSCDHNSVSCTCVEFSSYCKMLFVKIVQLE